MDQYKPTDQSGVDLLRGSGRYPAVEEERDIIGSPRQFLSPFTALGKPTTTTTTATTIATVPVVIKSSRNLEDEASAADKRRRESMTAIMKGPNLPSRSFLFNNALPGSRSAVAVDLPTITGRKPLPKALLPKEQRRNSNSYQSIISGPFAFSSGSSLTAAAGGGGGGGGVASVNQRRSSISGCYPLRRPSQELLLKVSERNQNTNEDHRTTTTSAAITTSSGGINLNLPRFQNQLKPFVDDLRKTSTTDEKNNLIGSSSSSFGFPDDRSNNTRQGEIDSSSIQPMLKAAFSKDEDTAAEHELNELERSIRRIGRSNSARKERPASYAGAGAGDTRSMFQERRPYCAQSTPSAIISKFTKYSLDEQSTRYVDARENKREEEKELSPQQNIKSFKNDSSENRGLFFQQSVLFSSDVTPSDFSAFQAKPATAAAAEIEPFISTKTAAKDETTSFETETFSHPRSFSSTVQWYDPIPTSPRKAISPTTATETSLNFSDWYDPIPMSPRKAVKFSKLSSGNNENGELESVGLRRTSRDRLDNSSSDTFETALICSPKNVPTEAGESKDCVQQKKIYRGVEDNDQSDMEVDGSPPLPSTLPPPPPPSLPSAPPTHPPLLSDLPPTPPRPFASSVSPVSSTELVISSTSSSSVTLSSTTPALLPSAAPPDSTLPSSDIIPSPSNTPPPLPAASPSDDGPPPLPSSLPPPLPSSLPPHLLSSLPPYTLSIPPPSEYQLSPIDDDLDREEFDLQMHQLHHHHHHHHHHQQQQQNHHQAVKTSQPEYSRRDGYAMENGEPINVDAGLQSNSREDEDPSEEEGSSSSSNAYQHPHHHHYQQQQQQRHHRHHHHHDVQEQNQRTLSPAFSDADSGIDSVKIENKQNADTIVADPDEEQRYKERFDLTSLPSSSSQLIDINCDNNNEKLTLNQSIKEKHSKKKELEDSDDGDDENGTTYCISNNKHACQEKEEEEEVPCEKEDVPCEEEEIPCEEEEASCEEEEVPCKEEEVPCKEQEVPCEEEVSCEEEEISCQGEEVSYEEEEVPCEEEEVPCKEDTVSGKEEEVLRDEEEVPCKEEEVPGEEEIPCEEEVVPNQEGIHCKEEAKISCKIKEVPYQEELLHKEKEVHPQPRKMMVPYREEEVPCKEEKVPCNVDEFPRQKEEEIPCQEKEVVLRQKEVPGKEEASVSSFPQIPEQMDTISETGSDVSCKGLINVEFHKGIMGVGFCIEGGKGYSAGDKPITVKRLFKGGTAAQGLLMAGDEIISVNREDMTNLTHYEAWNHIKSLPEGPIHMIIKRK